MSLIQGWSRCSAMTGAERQASRIRSCHAMVLLTVFPIALWCEKCNSAPLVMNPLREFVDVCGLSKKRWCGAIMPRLRLFMDNFFTMFSDGKGHSSYGHMLFKLLMIVDAVGLAIIAICTILEGTDDWQAPLSDYYYENGMAIFFWLSGLNLAVGGLIFLVINAAALETLPEWEHLGMAMLTFAPVINCIAWFMLETRDPFHVFNKQQFATEVLEFAGMNALNLTYFCGHNYLAEYILELLGYFVLACAAMLDVTYLPEKFMFPVIELRTQAYHRIDVVGLMMLAIVATGKYHICKNGGDIPPTAPPNLKPSKLNSLIAPKFAAS